MVVRCSPGFLSSYLLATKAIVPASEVKIHEVPLEEQVAEVRLHVLCLPEYRQHGELCTLELGVIEMMEVLS